MNYLEFLEKKIHSVVAATTDKNGFPKRASSTSWTVTKTAFIS